MKLKKFNIKTIVMLLIGIVLIAYGMAAIIFFAFGSFSFDKIQSNYNKFGMHGIFHISSENYNYHVNKAANIDGIDEISIDIGSGDIKFNNEGTNNIKVNVDGNISSSVKPQLKCYKQGKTLYVELSKNHGTFFGNYSSNITVNISLPTSYKNRLQIVSSAGDIEMSNYEFKSLSCELKAGSMNMENISADKFDYKNFAGDLKADNLKTKTSTVKASAGSIKIEKFSGDIQGTNLAGDTEVEYDEFNNNIDLSASAGQIKLTIPETSQFKLDAEARAGDISNDFSSINVSGEVKKTAKGEIGKSNNKIKLEDTAGDININN